MNTYRIWDASTRECITAVAEGDSPETAFEETAQKYAHWLSDGKYVVAIADGTMHAHHRQFAVMERVTPVVVNRKVEL